MACGILVPQPGIEPLPSAVKVQSSNHWSQAIPSYDFLTNLSLPETLSSMRAGFKQERGEGTVVGYFQDCERRWKSRGFCPERRAY